MIVPVDSDQTRINAALYINLVPVTEFIIKQYFAFCHKETSGQLYWYMNMFCARYNRKTWQHMRLPTTTDLDKYNPQQVYHIEANTYTRQLIQCSTPDAFFYLYQLTDTPIHFWNVLFNKINSVFYERDRFTVKHINWLIKLLDREPTD